MLSPLIYLIIIAADDIANQNDDDDDDNDEDAGVVEDCIAIQQQFNISTEFTMYTI